MATISSKFFVFVLLAGLVLFASLLFTKPVDLVSAVQAVGENLSEHAVAKHGSDATIIQNNLCTKGGPDMIYKAKGFDSFYLLTCLPDGRWGAKVCSSTGGCKTAFFPGDGTWNAVRAYFDKFATPYKDVLPWLKP